MIKTYGNFEEGENPGKVIKESELKTIADKWIQQKPGISSYDHWGVIDGGETLCGSIETSRGASYYIRFFYIRRFGVIKVVRSKYNTGKCDANSIRVLINGQIVKGKQLDVIDPTDYQ